jgi:transcriptional regulator with XRE-family HTH domain
MHYTTQRKIMTRESLAQIIKNRRKELKITQIELALLSDISTRQLSDIETAQTTTTIDTLSKICETLGFTIELKLKGVEL